MKSKTTRKKQRIVPFLLLVSAFCSIAGATVLANGRAHAVPLPSSFAVIKTESYKAKTHDTCGGGKKAVKISINIGCKGGGNAVTDMVFAIIRFLSIGAGIMIVASMVWAGVQYTMARDDPNKVGEAKQRIMNTFGALLIYIFAYAILNYVIPAGFFK